MVKIISTKAAPSLRRMDSSDLDLIWYTVVWAQWISPPNGISIGSAVFARLTIVINTHTNTHTHTHIPRYKLTLTVSSLWQCYQQFWVAVTDDILPFVISLPMVNPVEYVFVPFLVGLIEYLFSPRAVIHRKRVGLSVRRINFKCHSTIS